MTIKTQQTWCGTRLILWLKILQFDLAIFHQQHQNNDDHNNHDPHLHYFFCLTKNTCACSLYHNFVCGEGKWMVKIKMFEVTNEMRENLKPTHILVFWSTSFRFPLPFFCSLFSNRSSRFSFFPFVLSFSSFVFCLLLRSLTNF